MNKTSKSLLRLAVSGMISGLAAAHASQAKVVEEIVVTGRVLADAAALDGKLAGPVEEAPLSVTVLDAEHIAKQQLVNVSDALKYVAGARDKNGVWEHSDGYSLRGFDQSSYIVWDGLLRNDTSWWAASEPYSLEQILVVKGPASVMFGQAAPGGLVAMRSKRPQASPTQEVQLGVSQYNGRRLSADLGQVLDQEGDWLSRAVLFYSHEGDEIDSVEFDRQGILPSLQWQINDDAQITWIALWQKDEDDNNDGLPAEGTLFDNPNGKIPDSRYTGEPDLRDGYTTTQYSWGWEYEHRLSDTLEFVQNMRHFRVAVDGQYLGSDGFVNLNKPLPDGEEDLRKPTYDYRTINRYFGTYGYWVNSWQSDNQIQKSWAMGAWENNATLGFEYTRAKQDYSGSFGELSPLDVFNPVYGQYDIGELEPWNGAYGVTQKSIYGQNQAKWQDKWVVLTALRADASRTQERGEWVSDGAAVAKESAISGRLGVMYLTAMDISPYASYATSFLPLVGKTQKGEAFVPEEGQQMEVGLKYGEADSDFYATLALFDMERRNMLTRDPENDAFQVQNGAQRHRGIEIEFQKTWRNNIKTFLAYSQLDATVTESFDPGVQGKAPIDVPEKTASAWVEYDWYNWPALSFSAGYSQESHTYGDPENTLRQAGYALFDAGVHLDLDRYTMSLTGSNLRDEDYYTSCWGGNYCARGKGRSWDFRVTLKW